MLLIAFVHTPRTSPIIHVTALAGTLVRTGDQGRAAAPDRSRRDMIAGKRATACLEIMASGGAAG